MSDAERAEPGAAPSKVDVGASLARIDEHWRPKIVAELNGQEVKLARFLGEFVWHRHEREDELFLGVQGTFRVEFRDHVETIAPGQLIVVPRGREHRVVAEQEAAALLFEPAATRNTGDVVDAKFTAPGGVKL